MNHHDPLDTCPYDPVHRILRSRMQFHLTKCAKNFPCSKKKQCPYDARHVINQVEFKYHLDTCPSRESVWHYKLHDQEAQEKQRLLPVDPHPIAVSEENWENDAEVQSYNPLQNINGQQIIQSIIGAPKAERKKFRLDQRLRFQKLDDSTSKIELEEKAAATNNNTTKNITKSQPINNVAVDSNNAVDQTEKEYKPLRRPKKLQPDNLNISALSINDSVSVNQKENEISTVESPPTQKEDQEISNATSLSNQTPKTIPFSYAAALNRNNSKNTVVNKSIDSDYDVVIEDVKHDEKENLNNSSFLNRTADSVIDKLSKTVEQLVMDEEGYKKKTEPLNKQLHMYKMAQMNKNASLNNNSVNNSNTEKIFSRCAANFPVLK